MRVDELLRRGHVTDAGRSMLGGHATAVGGTLSVTYTLDGHGEASEVPLARRCALDALDLATALFALDDGILSRSLLLDGQAAAFNLAEEVAFNRLRRYALVHDPDAAYPDPAGLPSWVWEPAGTYSVRDLSTAYDLGRCAGAAGTSGGYWDAFRERQAGRDAT